MISFKMTINDNRGEKNVPSLKKKLFKMYTLLELTKH